MNSEEVFESVKDLPFADGNFKDTPKVKESTINFKLAKDATKTVTLFNIHDYKTVPVNLVKALENEFNYVVKEGRTYPYHSTMEGETFVKYWFTHFVSVLLEGEYKTFDELGDLSVEQWNQIFWGLFM